MLAFAAIRQVSVSNPSGTVPVRPQCGLRRRELEPLTVKAEITLNLISAVDSPARTVAPAANLALSTDAAPLENLINPVSDEDKATSLANSMRRARSLRSTHELITQQVDEVQKRLYKEELHRGQMIQQYLQLGRDIKQKEMEIGQQKAKLTDLRLSKDNVSDELSDLVAQIGRIIDPNQRH